METFNLTGTSNESMEAALANAMAQANNIGQDAIQVIVTPIAFMESDGSFRVRVMVDIVKEADLNEDQRRDIDERVAAFKAREEEDITDIFDEEATAMVMGHMSEKTSMEEDMEVVAEPSHEEEKHEQPEGSLTTKTDEIPEMIPAPAPEMEDDTHDVATTEPDQERNNQHEKDNERDQQRKKGLEEPQPEPDIA